MNEIKQKRSVLYIEDNPANLRLITQMLETLPNVEVLGALEPTLGLELAERHVPNLILLDINLPEMDGYEVFKKLRNNDTTCHIPVFAISANVMSKDLQKSEEAGFDRYITKPINVRDVLSIVENQLTEI